MRVANVKTTVRKFFHHWITVTYPIHNLGKTEKAVLAELLYFRYMLSQDVKNEDLVNKLLFDYEIKVKICEAIGIPKARMPLVLTLLRKKGIVKGRTLNKSYMPELKLGDKEFVMAYKFRLEDNEKGAHKKKVRKKTKTDSKEK